MEQGEIESLRGLTERGARRLAELSMVRGGKQVGRTAYNHALKTLNEVYIDYIPNAASWLIGLLDIWETHAKEVYTVVTAWKGSLEAQGTWCEKEDNAQRALEAWKAWWRSTQCFMEGWFMEEVEICPKGLPTYTTDDGDVICFFCGETLNALDKFGTNPDDRHDKNCPYLTVKQIAGEEGW